MTAAQRRIVAHVLRWIVSPFVFICGLIAGGAFMESYDASYVSAVLGGLFLGTVFVAFAWSAAAFVKAGGQGDTTVEKPDD